MAAFFKRLSKRMKMTTKGLASDLQFSPYYAWLRLCDELGGRLGFSKLSARSHAKKEQWIQNYLKTYLKPVLERMEADQSLGTPVDNAPVWVCWWTGEEAAPLLVKKCIESIRRQAGDHPVHMITRDNVGQYLTVPAHILEKFNKGQMCAANLTDYIRFSLLAKYGGLWLDATIFCSKPLPEALFTLPVFTCKGRTGDGTYISDYRWTTFCFGGHQGNVLFRYIQSAFGLYWKDHDTIIDYLMLDHLIELGHREIPAIRACLDAVPENNMHRDELQAAMNAARPASDLETILNPATTLYKLSWREQYQETTSDGELTIYGSFIQ